MKFSDCLAVQRASVARAKAGARLHVLAGLVAAGEEAAGQGIVGDHAALITAQRQ